MSTRAQDITESGTITYFSGCSLFEIIVCRLMNEFESNEDLVAMQLKSLNKLRNDGIRDISDFIAAAGLQNHIDTSGRWITNDFPLVTFIKELCCMYITLEKFIKSNRWHHVASAG